MVVEDKLKGQWNARLVGAIDMARQAGKEDLDTRRKKYCLATRFRGQWGSVWPDFEKEISNEDDDMDDEEELYREMIEEVDKDQNNNISLTHDESISEVLKAIPVHDVSVRGKKRACMSFDDEEERNPKAALPSPASISEKVTAKAVSSLKENVPPPTNIADLYADKSLYTQEISQQPSVSFQSEGGDWDNLNSSLKSGMDSVLQVLDNLTPIKKNSPPLPGILKEREREVVTPSNRSFSLTHSPAPSRLPSSTPTPGDHASFQTSTPARKTSMLSPSTVPLLSPGGDCQSLTDGCRLNTTNGSTAFSADGSFMEP